MSHITTGSAGRTYSPPNDTNAPIAPSKKDLPADRPYRVTQGGNPQFNLNGQLTLPGGSGNYKLSCRHLAAMVVHQILNKASNGEGSGKVNLKNFASADALLANIAPDPEQHYQALCKTATARHLLQTRDFGRFLEAQFTSMQPGETKAMLLHSSYHAMALRLRAKADEANQATYYVATFYDPNHTDSHVRYVAQNANAASALTLADFMTREELESYFDPNPEDQACLIHDCTPPISAPEVVTTEHCPNTVTAQQMYLSLHHGLRASIQKQLAEIFKQHPINMDLLHAYRADDRAPGLGAAMYQDHADTVQTYVAAVLSSRLKDEEKHEILLAKSAVSTGLYAAMSYGRTATVNAFTDAVLTSSLPDDYKIKLLAAQGANGCPALLLAMQNNHADTVKTFSDLLLLSKLEEADKLALLMAKTADGTPGLTQAMAFGHTHVVRAFTDSVLQSKLDAPSKTTLLMAQDPSYNDTPGLSVAMQYGHADAVKTFTDSVLQSTTLGKANKLALLMAKTADGVPGLTLAMTFGYTGAVRVFANAVLDSDLDETEKTTLLMAQDPTDNGTSGLSIAMHLGHTATAQAFVDAVQQSNLSLDAKAKLIR